MSENNVTADDIKQAIRNVPDFPELGIQFKDITPVLASGRLFAGTIELLAQRHASGSIDSVVGIDARGFIFAAAVAVRLGVGFVPVRKKGKLPFDTHEESYDLEYGSNTVAIHTDAVSKGSRVLLMDDLLATGGTAGAAIQLARDAGAEVLGCSFLVELAGLNGRSTLGVERVHSVIEY